MSFVQYFVVIMYTFALPCEACPWGAVCDEFLCGILLLLCTHLPCEACAWGAVCDEFCAVFCCYYVHICLVRRALGGLSVMSFVQYFVVIMYTFAL